MSISASEVNNLRKATGAGLMDCKKALTETNGDFDAAVDFLRKRGAKIAAKRADREATEGAVIALTSADNKTGVIVLLSCETDFVAKNDGFVAFAKEIAEVALAEKPADISALKTLKVGAVALEARLLEEVAKIGEKIDVVHYELVEGENIVPYIHAGNRMGVLVEMNNAATDANISAGKDVAMQIAAMNPVAVDKDGVDAATVEREMKIGREQAIAEGKPENIIDRIAEGKLQKFFKENTLLNQDFVKDSSMSVAKMLDGVEKGLTIKQFKRVQLG
ncbi:MAG: translation elongation factor Ts [Bacteroidia bacterium]|jgi:elongation factor Ts|nr:translation elongation factor Ts [Bacteroidia bacterium]MDA9213918.1 translation elongation factor Ts [Bacteroidia bacterium]MDG1747948.1 translation elongation factor Ts [Bacteroidia bacterium]